MQEQQTPLESQPTDQPEPSTESTESAPTTKPGSTGLEPNIAGALCYALTPITGIVFWLIEKDDKFVRFHAMQSIIFGFGAFIIGYILRFLPFGFSLSWLFNLIMLALWIVLIYKAYLKEEWELPIIGDIARQQLSK